MTFTANLSGGDQNNITYNWSVSAGTIESGQGTPSITVRTTPELAGGNVTATVNIGGTDPACNCTTSASETAGVTAPPQPTEVDTFGVLPADEVRGRLDAFFSALANDPTAQGYIITYGPARAVTARERLIRNHIGFRNFDASRITFVQGGDTGEGVKTRLFTVPAGATPPQP
jgi:hypothetical protein